MVVALPLPTPKEVQDFKKIYREKYGIEMTDKEAWDAATRTLRLFCLVTYGWPTNGKDAPEQHLSHPKAKES